MISSINNKNYKLIVILYAFYLVSLPLGMIALGNAGSALRYIAVIPILAWIILFRKIKLNNICIFHLLLTFYMLLTTLYSVDVDMTVTRSISNIMFLILLIAFSSVDFSESDTTKLKKALVLTSRISAIMLLSFGTLSEGRLVLNNRIIIEDANYMNAYLLFGIINAEMCFISKEIKVTKKVLYCFELIIYIYIALCTGSRSGLLMICVSAFAAFILTQNMKKKNKSSFLSKLISLVFISLIIYYVILTFVPTSIVSRFSLETILHSNGTNRYTIWNNGINTYIHSNLPRQIFGYGAGTIIKVFTMHAYRSIVMHQIYLEILVEDGIIGLILYLSFIFNTILLCIKKKDVFCLSIIIGLIVFGCAASIYAFKPYWNIILYLCAVNNQKGNTSEGIITLPLTSTKYYRKGLK